MKGAYKKNSSSETSRKLKILKNLRSLPFREKINVSKKIITEALKKGKPALLYSGGKDSTVLLHLLLLFDRKILIIHNNTTLGDPACLEYIRSAVRGLNYIETTAENPIAMWQKKGYYPILSKRGFTAYRKRTPGLRVSPVQCCYQLKEKCANPVLKNHDIKVVFWGNTAGESNRRKLSFVDNGYLFKPKKYPWNQCYPLQHFTHNDILFYLAKYVPGYPINKNFESGCLSCATDITYRVNNLSRLYCQNHQEWKRAMTSGFAREILKIKGHYNLTDEQIGKVITDAPAYLNHVGKR